MLTCLELTAFLMLLLLSHMAAGAACLLPLNDCNLQHSALPPASCSTLNHRASRQAPAHLRDVLPAPHRWLTACLSMDCLWV